MKHSPCSPRRLQMARFKHRGPLSVTYTIVHEPPCVTFTTTYTCAAVAVPRCTRPARCSLQSVHPYLHRIGCPWPNERCLNIAKLQITKMNFGVGRRLCGVVQTVQGPAMERAEEFSAKHVRKTRGAARCRGELTGDRGDGAKRC